MILIDSNVFIAYLVPEDSNHERAVRIIGWIANSEYGKGYSSDYIFDETVSNTLYKTKSVHKAITSAASIKESTEMLWIEDETFDLAWEKFKSQTSSKFSFTDCTNIALMETYGIENIATFDREFKDIRGINVIS